MQPGFAAHKTPQGAREHGTMPFPVQITPPRRQSNNQSTPETRSPLQGTRDYVGTYTHIHPTILRLVPSPFIYSGGNGPTGSSESRRSSGHATDL